MHPLASATSCACLTLALACTNAPPADSAASGGDGGEAPEVDLSEHTYDADDANILYAGRVDFTDPKRPRFSAPAVYVQARFVGTSATVRLQDQHRYGNWRNYYDVVIDDGPAIKLSPEVGETSYLVAEDLEPVEHTITVSKRTEANVGNVDFLGFTFTGEIQEPPARPERRMLFIGDSITCGSGNEAANNSEECSADGWGQPYHNARSAYGPVMARSLEAEYHVIAVSGIGLVRNYSSEFDARPMPEVFDLTYLESMTSPQWDPAAFVPDVVVVALGTNDFSPGDSERPMMEVDTFVDAYVTFVEKLRGHYPEAHIFAVSSPMLGDGWPDATYQSLTDQRSSITAVGEHFADAGDDKVHSFIATRLTGSGCGTHPSAEQHEILAAELEAFVKETVGW